MRELAERFAPEGKSISLGGNQKSADDDGADSLSPAELADYLFKSVGPKIAGAVEAEVNKLRGKLD
jgi:hypothetical protein